MPFPNHLGVPKRVAIHQVSLNFPGPLEREFGRLRGGRFFNGTRRVLFRTVCSVCSVCAPRTRCVRVRVSECNYTYMQYHTPQMQVVSYRGGRTLPGHACRNRSSKAGT